MQANKKVEDQESPRRYRQRSELPDPSKPFHHRVNQRDTLIMTMLRSSVVALFEREANRRRMAKKDALEAALQEWLDDPQTPPAKSRWGEGPKDDPFVPFAVRTRRPFAEEFSATVKASGHSKVRVITHAISIWATHAPSEAAP